MLGDVQKSSLLVKASGLIKPGATTRISGLWGSSVALVAAALVELTSRPILFITTHLDNADELADDVEVLRGRPAQLFPAWEVESPRLDAGKGACINDEVNGERIRLCSLLGRAKAGTTSHQPTDEPVDFLVAPVMAILQGVPGPGSLKLLRLPLKRGSRLGMDELASWLVDAGYENVEQVDQQGEFARRGGIVDIFPPGASQAVRVEFFGDEIDSIRKFDLDSQRSTQDLPEYEVTGYASAGASGAGQLVSLLEYLPADTIICMDQPGEVLALAREIHRRLSEDRPQAGTQNLDGVNGQDVLTQQPTGLLDVEDLFSKFSLFALVEMSTFGAGDAETAGMVGQVSSGGATGDIHLRVQSLAMLSMNSSEALAELQQLSQAAVVHVYCENPAEQKRFGEVLAADYPQLANRVRLAIGHINGGFYWPAQKLVVVGHHEIFHRYTKVRRLRRIRAGRPIESLLELREGDYVVHVAHGIARFEGLKVMQQDGRSEEYLVLRFADNAVLHVPSGKIDLVQKYIGTPAKKPSLSKLGSAGWLRQKQRAQEAVQDLAAEMLRVQAMRQAMPGVSYPIETQMQREFCQEFLYSETEDQITAMRQIDQDMLAQRPMDRLLCGDVGYGKTELAMRAAFKVVEAGGQVAILVPTTVLAAQHYRTFSERFADYPVSVDVISRLRSPRERKDVLKRVAAGGIDVLIGTHRILSPDVHFANLGLVIIDEEQRFGVEDKECLKGMRSTVDVLTMTATPIPRTLHMSMLGLRDISSLSTPPMDRRAIHTEVMQLDERFIRQVILRELNRQGQVFFVHNRVMDIDSLANRIKALVPEARVAVGHGQMSEGQLERAMLRFVRQDIDVLVCTTIIESGLDIPTANTIIIHNADRFGLAELHQLRGRVGRYKHRAFCYLVLPQDRPINAVAAKRLKAIEEFSDLGAGFQIAMRDLEIRGAGNILGKQQSGHIAAVGYELYCQLLESSVRQLRGEKPLLRHDAHVELGLDALIPQTYIPVERQRMEVYRRLVKCAGRAELKQLSADLIDAYGPLPPDAQRLLDMTEIRVLASELTIDSIIRMDPDIIFRVRNLTAISKAFDQSIGSVRLADERTMHWRPPAVYMKGNSLINVLLKRLRTACGSV
jgi:transcription-repair coupling factor (superfamily II helicase)